MDALVMTGPSAGPDRTEVRAAEPPRPASGQVTVDVAYAGINFLDVMARRGDPGHAPAWPYVPGLEVAGRVRETGAAVTGLAPGDRVAAFLGGGGGLAEVALADADAVVPVPDGVPAPAAAGAPLMLTAALLLLDDAAGFRPGARVLVHSAGGGMGTAIAGLVPLLGGGTLIGTVGRPEKAAAARASGYDAAFARDAGLADAVRAASGGGVDIVLDPLGTAALETDLAVAAPGARIVLYGNAGGGALAALPPAGRLIGGNLSVGGFSVSGLWSGAPRRAAIALRRVLDLVAGGGLGVATTEVPSLAAVPEVHQALAEGRGAGKYVVRVSVAYA